MQKHFKIHIKIKLRASLFAGDRSRVLYVRKKYKYCVMYCYNSLNIVMYCNIVIIYIIYSENTKPLLFLPLIPIISEQKL